MKSRWIMGVALSLSLLLASCDDNIASEETQNTAVPITVPKAALVSPSNEAMIAYEVTRKHAQEKADLLTKAYSTNSVQYAIIDHGNIVVSGQTGKNDERGQNLLTEDTMYGIGSTSKMFTAVAVMQLVDQGKIDLDKPVVHYIPEFTMKDERY